MVSGTMEGLNLEQVERSFGLTLSTRGWSTRSSTNCPRMLPVVEIRWWDGWPSAFLTVGAMLRSVEADDAPDVDASVD